MPAPVRRRAHHDGVGFDLLRFLQDRLHQRSLDGQRHGIDSRLPPALRLLLQAPVMIADLASHGIAHFLRTRLVSDEGGIGILHVDDPDPVRETRRPFTGAGEKCFRIFFEIGDDEQFHGKENRGGQPARSPSYRRPPRRSSELVDNPDGIPPALDTSWHGRFLHDRQEEQWGHFRPSNPPGRFALPPTQELRATRRLVRLRVSGRGRDLRALHFAPSAPGRLHGNLLRFSPITTNPKNRVATMFLRQITDETLSQYTYLIGCEKTGEALLVDPERDIDRYFPIAEANDLEITAVAETHIHADFLSGTREFIESREKGIAYLSGAGGPDWQYIWAEGIDRVRLLRHGDTFSVGDLRLTALHTPGHTPEHLCFLLHDGDQSVDEPLALLSGDFLFVGDVGRPDLLDTAAGEDDTRGPAARDLFASIQQIDKVPDFVLVLPAHGAGSSCGKALGSVPFSSMGYEKRANDSLAIAREKGEDAFVEEILSGQPEPPNYFARMKELNRSGAPILGVPTHPRRLNDEDVATLLSRESGEVVFLDTRTDRTAFMEQHLEDSLFAPFGASFLEAAGSYLDSPPEIFLMVTGENEVEPAVRQLARIGFDRIGGYALWPEISRSEACQGWLRSTRTIEITEIDPSDRVLDVRSAEEYEEAHVPDAHHLPHTRLVAEADSLPEPGPITVQCGSGLRAALASAQLERSNFDVTFANGRFADWKEQAERVATGA